jgi:hypothetical protein
LTSEESGIKSKFDSDPSALQRGGLEKSMRKGIRIIFKK